MHRALTFATLALGATAAFGQRSGVPAGDSAAYAPDVLSSARRDYFPIRACYDVTPRAALARIRTLSLIVREDGSVADLDIDPPVASVRRFRSCLAPVVRAWHLPAPNTHAAVRITFAFDELQRGVEQASP